MAVEKLACGQDRSKDGAVVSRAAIPATTVKLVLALGNAAADAASDAGHVVGIQLTHSPLAGAQTFQVDADRLRSSAAEHQRFRSSPQFSALQCQAPGHRFKAGRLVGV